VSALSAQAILLRDPGNRANQIATLLVAGAAWWGFCQTLWTLAPDAATAYFWHHLAGPGWAFIGPLALHLLSQHARPPGWMRYAIPPAYLMGGVFAVLQLCTSWLHTNAFRTPLGWGFEPGPGHIWFLAFTFGCVIPAIGLALIRVRQAPSPAERSQTRLVGIGIAAPFLLAGLTGGILPVLGVQLPRLGAISFGILGVTIAWSYYRYGFSALAPAAFSREILATLPDGLALVGLNGEGRSGNERMAQLLGIEHADLIDHPIGDAFSDPVLDPPRELREHECRLRSRRGEEIAVSVSTSLLLDKPGLPIGIVLVVRDLRELVELRNHLVTSGRLAAVGELAAGIAHEINNPIAFVRANLSQLQQSWDALAKRMPADFGVGPDGVDLVSEGEELLEECIEGVERTVRIVQDVRGFAHAGGDEHELLDLNELLARVLRVAQPQLRYGVRLDSDLGAVPRVLGTAAHLQQVFLNLVLNAIQSIEAEGRVLVETRANEDSVIASVSDDGHGIRPEDQERIFDPFFTTKPVGEGTGLGLAISFQIVERHDAQLGVESELGVGTRFTVRFPRPAESRD
jgi:PAS domain S-box-containing protein